MRPKEPNECPQDCPGRSPTCHATCEIHRKAWEKRRKLEKEDAMQSVITDYTVKEIMKAKSGKHSPLSRYRSKGGRRG